MSTDGSAMSTERTIELPEVGLVLLCGASGSGKSAFARAHFGDTEVVSSDRCRALVGDDENDQAVTKPAFELLANIVEARLKLGRFTVVDATNVKAEDRKGLRDLARKWDVLATAIVFNLPLGVCLDRNEARADRRTPAHAVKRQHTTLRRGLKRMGKERYNRVHVLTSEAEVDSTVVQRTRLWNDRRDDAGPFDLIGDVHGCYTELIELLGRLGYDTAAEPIRHPDGRRVLFLGDLVDRGPASDRVLETAMSMVEAGSALCILGNHENKLSRALAGRKVTVSHGLAETLEQLEKREAEFSKQVAEFIDGLVSHYVLDGGRLVVAHAGLPERYHGRTSGRVRNLAMYGDTDGETDEFGLPIRYPWAEDYRGKATVVYGHTPIPKAEWLNNTICLDTGAVHGGDLTAMRWPEKELVSVPAAEEYFVPVRPLGYVEGAAAIDGGSSVSEASPAGGRPGRLLSIDDVVGKHHIETSLAGRLTVDGERSSAALEVMSRFAVDPRWLVYLPPTMAPAATSDRPDYLEHPDEAFAYYRSAGVGQVVCQEKHMGSRAVVVVARNADAAHARFGITNEAAGVIVTRTGRSFFADEAITKQLLDRLRNAVEASDLWNQLDTDWLVLDAELLPWSAKAGELLERQYAPAGASGSAMLSDAASRLAAAAERGVPVDDLLARTLTRSGHVAAFNDAYRQYCWTTDGAEGIELAPFQILAAEGRVLARWPHAWHLQQIDGLVAADPGLFRPTERHFVDLADEASVHAAIEWWLATTKAGGEGMVVKPAQPVVEGGRHRLVLPGVKCRGREYLRIVYGPEYLEPSNLERLRSRSLGRKSSLARREFALGIEALDRFVGRQHLSAVHECVFAVLALESEPVDPRL